MYRQPITRYTKGSAKRPTEIYAVPVATDDVKVAGAGVADDDKDDEDEEEEDALEVATPERSAR
jgi:hypothetical protein